MKRITEQQLDALYRVALAEFFTSPTTRNTTVRRYDVRVVLQQLEAIGLIAHTGRFVLTDAGRVALDAQLDGERAAPLVRMRARRAARPT